MSAVMVMVTRQTALNAAHRRYHRHLVNSADSPSIPQSPQHHHQKANAPEYTQ